MNNFLLTTIAGLVVVGTLWFVIRILIKGFKGTLHGDCERGDIEGVKRHLADGADVNEKKNDTVEGMIVFKSLTPLHFATREGHNEIAELLISRGADLNSKDESGWTPLHWASRTGHKEVTELLISKGADVNAKDENGSNPLHQAAMSCGDNYEKIIELLIANGADVNAKYEEPEYEKGKTSLHYAAMDGSKKNVELLIANGANVNSLNDEKKTPLDMLSSEELIGETAETAIFLRKHGGKTGEELKSEGK